MKSNHQPYEEWILSGRDLGQDQSQALKEHLRTCNACRRLSNAWLQVEGQLNLAPMALPEPGFGDRWLARLEVESQRRWRQQTFLVMLFSVGGAVFLAVLLSLLFFPVLRNPAPIFLAWIYELIGDLFSLATYAEVGEVFVRTMLGVVPEAVWLAIIGGVGALGVLWIIAYQKFTSERRVSL